MKLRTVAVFSFLLLLLAAAPVRAAEGEFDDWYALFLSGTKVGYFHLEVEKAEEGGQPVWVQRFSMLMSMARLGNPMTIEQTQVEVESDEGQVLRYTSEMKQGPSAQKTEGVFADGKMKVDQMGKASVYDYPEGAVGDVALHRTMREKGLAPGTKYEVTVFDTETPDQAVTATVEVGKPAKKDILGRVVTLTPVKTTRSNIPMMAATQWMNEDFEVLLMEMNLPFGLMQMYLTEEEIAKADIEPAEVMTSTLITPDKAIPEPRELRHAVYRLTKKDGSLPEIYEGESQRVVKKGEASLDLEVTFPKLSEGAAPFTLPVADPKLSNYLSATPYLEIDDEKVKEHAANAVGEEKDALKAAGLIENYVREVIKNKSLGVGFATAAEVARSLEGDCSEHAVLACALARAVGLPARVVTGIVYLPDETGPGFFGYHMWTEVLVSDDCWIPIDAAIGCFDATHIALQKSDLTGPSPAYELGVKLFGVMGQLKIQVIEP